MIYEYFTDIFPYEKFPVEYLAYQQLKDTPNLNYIAVPWTQILNSVWINYPNAKPQHEYYRFLSKEKISQENNFTICQHDDYMSLRLYFKHLKIKKVFCPLHNINNKIDGIDILPISFTSSFNFETKDKDILFSFVGTPSTHHIRMKMANRIQGIGIIYREGYHVDPNVFNNINTKEKEEKEYKEVLERSRFSLCPRGSSPSSVRFWESIDAGAIPILISDYWVLPEWDWNNTIIHIKENEFEKMDYNAIKQLLGNISPEKEQSMRLNCQKAHEKFKKENYFKYIQENL